MFMNTTRAWEFNLILSLITFGYQAIKESLGKDFLIFVSFLVPF